MNTQLKDLYRRAGDAVEPGGDVTQVLAQAQRRRVRSQVATPIASAAVVAGAVGFAVAQPWADDLPASDVAGVDAAALPDPATVAGNTYVVDDAESSGMPKSADVEITFRQGTYSATAGCNTFNGRYDMSDDVLVASTMGATMAYCPGRAGTDEWLESFLGSGPEVSIDSNELRLDNGKSDVALTVEEKNDKPLEGTRWRLDSIVSGEAVSSVPRGVKATLSYDGDDRLAVSSGCATGTAEVSVSDGSMQIAGDVAESAPGDCPEPKVDRSVREALEGPIGYEIDGNQLQVRTKDGALVYTAN